MLPISRLSCTRILAKRCAYSTDEKKLGLETKAGKMSFSLPFKYISAEQLAEIIKAKPAETLKDLVVVDVRDSDFVGGNIVSALNYPSDTFHATVDELVEKLENVPRVVFHCYLSQARGPKAARIYAETRNNRYPNPSTPQEIFVLRDGFSGFQSRYRHDPELIEKFDKYYHD
ncbi:hypothetical protein I305_03170 [Cryptococcus gattii E566]|uniref:Rhodanese domain-containing protein n=2 Tax=Cryptococcus gattii TaxID=37769 RepID=E6QZ60_CRYGW|nr:phosphatase YCH1 CGB_A1290W [Cryptococcus gattii WM276]ADV19390.1 Hypothetical protein CGB_A1290W [Cryptococcus gattii WM276]KIR79970.1 hypothetical protein I306_02932 [Cryptococcus gattii EJB2]KIY34388.1 hypothetical protein I305_03170 [Cryptococcus gattii E566]KJE05253.1 hypothetical protein I311_00930 [Cryptococcus gattii NT-10]